MNPARLLEAARAAGLSFLIDGENLIVEADGDLPAELIPKAFEKYYEMNKIQIDKWYLSHLFAVPARYAEVKSLIQQNMEGLTAAKKAEYLLHERSMADFVFTFSEQNLFQWDLTRDREREIINDVLGYLSVCPGTY